MSKKTWIFVLCIVLNSIIPVTPKPKPSPWPSSKTTKPKCPRVPRLGDIKSTIKNLSVKRTKIQDLKTLETKTYENENDCENNIVELVAEELNLNDDLKDNTNENNKSLGDDSKENVERVEKNDDQVIAQKEKDKTNSHTRSLLSFIPIFRQRKPARTKKRLRNKLEDLNSNEDLKENNGLAQTFKENNDIVVQVVKNSDEKPIPNTFVSEKAIDKENIHIVPLNSNHDGKTISMNTFPLNTVISNTQPLILAPHSTEHTYIDPPNAIFFNKFASSDASLNTIPANVVSLNRVLENGDSLNTVPEDIVSSKTLSENTIPLNIVSANDKSVNAGFLNDIPMRIIQIAPENFVSMNTGNDVFINALQANEILKNTRNTASKYPESSVLRNIVNDNPMNIISANEVFINKIDDDSKNAVIQNRKPVVIMNDTVASVPQLLILAPRNTVHSNAVPSSTISMNMFPENFVSLNTVAKNTVSFNTVPANDANKNTVIENDAINAIPLFTIPKNVVFVNKVPVNSVATNSKAKVAAANKVPNENIVLKNTKSENTVIVNKIPDNFVIPANMNPLHSLIFSTVTANNNPANIPLNTLPTINSIFTNGIPLDINPRNTEPLNITPLNKVPSNTNPVKASCSECHKKCSDGSKKADLVLFMPEEVSLVNLCGDFLKKVTMTVLVPMHVSKLDL